MTSASDDDPTIVRKQSTRAFERIAGWTGDLVAAGSSDDLDQLRFLLAAAEGADGVEDAAESAERPTLDADFTPEITLATRAMLAEGRLHAAPPRTTSLGALVRGESLVRSAIASTILGPFRDRLGLLRWFDFYRPAARLLVFEPGDATPVLVLTSARISRLGTLEIDLEPGTVWLRANKLVADPAMPSELFLSLRVRDGKLNVAGASAASSDTLTLPGPISGSLDMALEPLAAAPSACGGPSIQLPERVILRWSGAGVSGELVGGGVEAFGTVYDLSGAAQLVFDPLLRTVVARTRAVPGTIDASLVESKLGALSGVATIDSAGLALPGFTPTSPASLPEAVAGASYVMHSSSDLRAKVRTGGVFSLPDTTWLFAASGLFIASTAATGDTATMPRMKLHRQSVGEHRIALELDTSRPGMFGLGWSDDAGTCVHTALLTASTWARFDRPLDVLGNPLRLDPTSVALVLQRRDDTTTATLLGSTWTSSPRGTSMAIENAVMRASRARLLGITGTLIGDDDLEDGTAWIELELAGWVPTQPDPYVSSIRASLRKPRGGSRAFAKLSWTDRGPATVAFEGLLADPATVGAPDTPPAVQQPHGDQAAKRRVRRWRLSSQTTAGRVARSDAEAAKWQQEEAAMHHRLAAQQGRANEINGQLVKRLRGELDEISPRVDGPLFLDVSTRRHQIGVQVGMRTNPDGRAAATVRLSGMRIVAPLQNVRVFTVPQVQWEPVRTLDKDQKLDLGLFPTPLASRDDGGATLIATRSSRLAPVIPDLALVDMVEERALGRPMAISTTLPFGLAATIKLRTPGAAGAPDQVDILRPAFPERALEGAHQLRLIAGGVTIPGGPSAHFEGRTAQLLNGSDLATGSPLGISVLGSTLQPDSAVESMFNREFASDRPRVPLTRLDLSGYGASTFSDWTNPQGAFAEATKVQFQLLVGRTALEIIKFASIIYPWGIRVTRAVTIERTGGAGVIRRDTGWQASSDGLFDFRWQEAIGSPPTSYVARPNPFTFHPGLVQGVHRVTRIRPAPGEKRTLPDGGEVVPLYFDADVYLDGVEGGVVRSEGMLGFLHLAPVGRIISNADLAAMLADEGGVGGPIDARVDVAGSSFAVRALRVEATPTADGTAIVCAVRGAPQFRAGGAWSTVRMPGPTNTSIPPEAVALGDGVPLVQPGVAIDPTGDRVRRSSATIGSYRFAEPVDLLRPTTPAFDVAFLQTTPTHAFVFRRPFIATGTGRIESTLAPQVADLFARSSFRSLFPPPDAAITLSDRPYWLRIGAGGAFRLEPSVALPSPRPVLVLSAGPDAGRRMFYDETTLSLSIGETSWSMSMPRLRMWSDLPEMNELIGMRMGLVGGSAIKSQLVDVESLVHSALASALTFLPGIAGRAPVGPIDLTPTNLKTQSKLALTFSGKVPPSGNPLMQVKYFGGFDITGINGGLEEPPAGAPPPTGPVTIAGGGGLDYGTFGIKVGFEFRAKTPTVPWFLVFGILVEVGGKFFLGDKNNALIPEKDRKDKVVMTFKVYLGVGYGADLGPFSAKVFIAAGPVFIIEGSTFKRGGFLMFEAKAGVSGIVTVKVFGEFQCVCFTKALPAGPKDYLQFSGELGINIEILFFSIKMSVAVVGDQPV